MGTNNFYYRNTDRLYAIEDADEFTLDDVRENFRLFKFKGVRSYRWDKNYRDRNELRSYGSSHIGSLELDDTSFGFDIGVDVNIVLRGGYYDGACFDYNICFFHEWAQYTELTDLNSEEIRYHFDLSPKQSERVATAMRRKFEKMEARVLKQMYRFLNENSTQYRKVGAFSNGETFYEKSEK